MINKYNIHFSLICAFLGIIDSSYLAYIKFSNNKAACIQGLGDCWTVNTSRYSEIFKIPISLLGAIAYLALGLLIIIGLKNAKVLTFTNFTVFGISLTGTIYSVYLTYLEIAVIRALCPFCLISLVLMAIIFILSIFRLNNFQKNF